MDIDLSRIASKPKHEKKGRFVARYKIQQQQQQQQQHKNLQHPESQLKSLNIKTRPTPAVTRCPWVIHNLELAPNQLHGVVHRAA